MRKLFNFAFSLLILIMNASCCSRDRISKEIRAFYESHIDLAIDSMINLSTKNQIKSYKEARYIYIMYVDSTSCSDCVISNLADWSQLNIINAFQKGTLRYVFVFAPKQNQRMHVLDMIKRETVFNEFVYVDTTGIFKRRNPKLPTNKLLHTFLINKQGNVELIGNPIANVEIKKMLMKILGKK